MWWVQVRSIDGRRSVRVDVETRLSKIEQVRQRLVDHFDVQPCRQRLFYRGKQLEDGHTLFEYDVIQNDVIQLMVRPALAETTPQNRTGTCEVENGAPQNGTETSGMENGKYSGLEMVQVPSGSGENETESPSKHDHKPLDECGSHKRPRENGASDCEETGSHDHENRLHDHEDWSHDHETSSHDHEDPMESSTHDHKNGSHDHETSSHDLEDPMESSSHDHENGSHDHETGASSHDHDTSSHDHEASRSSDHYDVTPAVPECEVCLDNPRRKCRHCACCVCGGKDSPEKQVLCDECDMAYHLWCLTPELQAVPEEDDWYCPDCKTDSSQVIAAGEKLRVAKKVKKCERDWGCGMATASRSKTCTIVPKNHFGSVPGVPVGSSWLNRMQVSESGVHLPPVAGIHGRAKEGAFSIVLSGGFKEDIDDGDEFVYSGCGSKDLSGNKRTSTEFVCDQKMALHNRALAVNCDAPVDDRRGATGKDWRKGKPVRVVRNYKSSKLSKYAPKVGNRYDGLYKVVKYWPEKNKGTGFIVWKYLMRRDDPAPAPWTSKGKKMIETLGLSMEYPEGYSKPAQNRKRKKGNMDGSEEPSVAPKQPRYELTKEQLDLIEKDAGNKKLWSELLVTVNTVGTAGLLTRIQDAFTCVICQEVVYQPVTLSCSHNVCKHCLMRSFKADVHSCPSCRQELDQTCTVQVNSSLQNVLLTVFSGYNKGRK